LLVTCHKCGSKYQLKADVSAGKARCKKCGEMIEIASAGSTPGRATEAKTVITPPPTEAKTRNSQSPPASSSSPTPVAALDDDAEDPLIGQTLGGYEIIRKLGEGGMGAVYEARQLSLDRSVALKILPPALARNKEFVKRFVREAHAVARLNHANIIQIFDVSRAEGIYFFAMEFVRGETLDRPIKRSGKMDCTTAVGYIIQAARGLEYAHRKGIIHRDIKPENIMINEEGIAKVADLGLAKQLEQEDHSMTLSGVAMGTPYYMAPEQGADAKHVDARADIYSLGCSLYHMVTGRLPHEGGSAYEIITKHLEEPIALPHVIDPHISEEVSGIIKRMLAKKPEDRYQNMGELIADLEKFLGVNLSAGWEPTEEEIRIIAEHAEQIERIRADKKSRTVLLGLSALAVIFILLSTWQGWRFAIGVGSCVAAGLLGYGVVLGIGTKSHLYRRIRKYLFGNSFGDWLTIVVILAMFVGLVLVLSLVPHVLAALVLGIGAATGYYLAMKRPLLARQAEVIEEIRKFVRQMRRHGVPEEEIFLFVCRHGGKDGEYLCEAVFGYDAVLTARTRRSKEELEQRTTLVNLREWLIARINAAEETRDAEKKKRRHAAEERILAAETDVMIAAADATAEEIMEAEILEEEKPDLAARILGVPRFIISGRGRVAVGALMVLLAGLALSNYMFGESALFGSYSFLLCALAVLASGFTRSKVMLACLLLSFVIAGPVRAVAGTMGRITIPYLDLEPSYTFIGGLFFFILAFAAGIIFRRGKSETYANMDEVSM